MSDYSISQLLDTSADLIKEKGWQINMIGHDDIGYCIIGAVQHVAYEESNRLYPFAPAHYLTVRMVDCLAEVLGFGETLWHDDKRKKVAAWNDNQAKSKEEVITALRLAAENAREEE